MGAQGPVEPVAYALADLRVAAEGATHQSWAAFTDDSGPRPHTNLVSFTPHTDVALAIPGAHKRDPNVAFIGTATPARILFLLDSHAVLLEALKLALPYVEDASDSASPADQEIIRAAIQSATGERA